MGAIDFKPGEAANPVVGMNNQIAFGPDGCVYWSQGSHTAMGAPDQKWGGNRVERLLSAAAGMRYFDRIEGKEFKGDSELSNYGLRNPKRTIEFDGDEKTQG